MSTYLSSEDDSPAAPSGPANGLEGVSRIRTVHLRRCKEEGTRFSMLTSYDAMTARIFDEAGVEVLLVGDSAANTVLGLESTTQLRMEDFLPFVRAVSRTARRAMVVADLPFGTYEASPAQAVEAAVRLVREGGAHAVKMEGGAFYAEHVRAMVQAGVPVMAHLGFTPQSEHVLGGFRVQGRNAQAEGLVEDARRLEEAGAFAVLLFQDISVVAILALMPLVASSGTGGGDGWLLSALQSTGTVGAAILAVVLVGRYGLNPFFGLLAASGAREVMTAAALLVVLGTAMLMEHVGLSMAMGAFLAGVLLAESNFRHQLEADIELSLELESIHHRNPGERRFVGRSLGCDPQLDLGPNESIVDPK